MCVSRESFPGMGGADAGDGLLMIPDLRFIGMATLLGCHQNRNELIEG